MLGKSFMQGEQRVERRLGAVFAGDVAGYSRLMGVDETGTLRTLQTHRKELINPLMAAYHGRIVKTTGDGILAETASAVDAVGFAVVMQKKTTLMSHWIVGWRSAPLRHAAAVAPLNFTLLLLSSSLALTGHYTEAHETIKRYLALDSVKSTTIAQLRVQQLSLADNTEWVAYNERLFDGLRKAGMPEQ